MLARWRAVKYYTLQVRSPLFIFQTPAMKRIALFLVTNLAVMVVLSITMNLLGVGRYLTANGIEHAQLLNFSALFGFAGAFISLLMSNWLAKTSTGAHVIDPNVPANKHEAWLIDTVHPLADRAGLGRPEVETGKAAG